MALAVPASLIRTLIAGTRAREQHADGGSGEPEADGDEDGRRRRPPTVPVGPECGEQVSGGSGPRSGPA